MLTDKRESLHNFNDMPIFDVAKNVTTSIRSFNALYSENWLLNNFIDINF